MSSSGKRQKVDGDVEDDGDELLKLMLQSQQPSHQDNDEDLARQRRREERRKRYKVKIDQEAAEKKAQKENHEEQTTTSTTAITSESQSTAAKATTTIFPSHLQKDDNNNKNVETKADDDDDDFDMFTSSVSPIRADGGGGGIGGADKRAGPGNRKKRSEDVQDSEGYYKSVLGEILEISTTTNDDQDGKIPFKVLGVVGKGVFSTVLKCTNTKSQETVALKMIRNNETMARVAQDEVKFLQTLQSHSHVVSLLLPKQQQQQQQQGRGSTTSTAATTTLLEHYGHVVLVFPFLPYNLRDVLKKFGKGVGLSLTGVAQYFSQLLSALLHCQKHQVIHADLKPDNILVSADFSICQICDFGSAMEGPPPPSEQDEQQQQETTSISSTFGSNLPTPYLVSRFYRAPEIMLGIFPITYSIDLWSIAVTIVELYLGKLWLSGSDNNEMLYSMMERLGPIPSKTIKQHYVALSKYSGFTAHFTYKAPHHYWISRPIKDTLTNTTIVKEVNIAASRTLHQFPNQRKSLSKLIMNAKSSKDIRHHVQQFMDLLTKCLNLDGTKRISIRNAMHHEFFKSYFSSNPGGGAG